MRRTLAVVAALLCCLFAAACGATKQLTITTPAGGTITQPAPACGQNGTPGACAPKTDALGPVSSAPSGVLIEDRSDNNPCDCGAQIKAAGFRGLIVKLNQGSEIDPTAARMAASARKADLAVGGYDFDADYSIAEAKTFIAAARAAGLKPGARNQLPLYFDVEWGNFSLTGLRAQIRYVQSKGWKVAEYTGEWYWTPHAGDTWTGVDAWLSGYPNAPVPPGVPTSLYRLHQFTDSPIDESVFLVNGRPGTLAQFEAYVNAKPKPKVSPRKKREAKLEAEIRHQRVILRAGHCYAHHTRGNCSRELAYGQKLHRELNALMD